MGPRAAEQAIAGAALTFAREYRGLTQKALAEQSGVTRQQIANLEKGATLSPAPETLAALAEVLRFSEDFFRAPPPVGPSEGVLHFRGAQRASKRTVRQLRAQAVLWTALIDRLVELTPSWPQDGLALPEADADDAEAAAAAARTAWGLKTDGPIDNMVRLLERQGAAIGLFRGEVAGVDAYSWRGSRPLVLCNIDRSAPSRARFSLAHEAAHLALHKGLDTEDPRREGQADRFASALLMPKVPFFREFPRAGRRLDWTGMMKMKVRWGVSISALVHRASDLGLLSRVESRKAWIHISKNGWRKTEPYEREPTTMPELTVHALKRLPSAAGVSPDELLDYRKLPREALATLTGDWEGVTHHEHGVTRLVGEHRTLDEP